MAKKFYCLLFFFFCLQCYSYELQEVEEKESYRNDAHLFSEVSFSFENTENLDSVWTGQRNYAERNFPAGFSINRIFPDLLKIDDGVYIFFYFDSTIAPNRFVVDNEVVAFIPQSRDSVYSYMIPGFPASNNGDIHYEYPDWARCVEKHILTNENKIRVFCEKGRAFTKRIVIPKEKDLNNISIDINSLNPKQNESMDIFLCDDGKCKYRLHMDNLVALRNVKIRQSPILEKYVNLYTAIRQELDFKFEGCYWSNLIQNLNDFTIETDFPTSFSDVHGCPTVKR